MGECEWERGEGRGEGRRKRTHGHIELDIVVDGRTDLIDYIVSHVARETDVPAKEDKRGVARR